MQINHSIPRHKKKEVCNMTRQHKSEIALHTIAKAIAQSITIRTWNNGNSYDDTREATEQESEIICNIAFSALLGLNFGETTRALTMR